MGLFDIFDKKECSVCGGEIGLLGNRKLEDGNLCKECAKKLSPFFSERRHSTVDEIKEQLAYREANEGVYAAFNTTKQYGSSQIIRIDENKRQFTVSYSTDGITPDVISFDQVTGCTSRVDDSEVELKRDGPDGQKISYSPRMYLHRYYFRLNITVNHPYFENINFQLNSQPLEISDLDRRNPVGNSGGILGALLGNSTPMSVEDRQYQQYQDQCNEIISILNSKGPSVSRASASASEKMGAVKFYTEYKGGTSEIAADVTCSFAYSYKIANQQIYDIGERAAGVPAEQAIEKTLTSMMEMELTKYFRDGITAEALQNPPAAVTAAMLANAAQPVYSMHGIELTDLRIVSMQLSDETAKTVSMAGAVSAGGAASSAEWVCEYCGSTNSSNFCSGCGSKRP